MNEELYLITAKYKGKKKDLSQRFVDILLEHGMEAKVVKYSNVKGAEVSKR